MKAIVISNLDEQVFELLKLNADLHGVSPEEEAKSMLEQNLIPNQTNKKQKAREFLKQFRLENAHRQKTDSVHLIREDRNR